MQLEAVRFFISKIMGSVYFAQLIAVLLTLIVLPLVLWGISETVEFARYPTADKVEAEIRRQLSVGTDKAEVIRFLHAYNFRFSELPVNEQAKSLSVFLEPKIKAKSEYLKSYIQSSTDVANPRWIFTCWSSVAFFFDANEKLIDFVANRPCDGP